MWAPGGRPRVVFSLTITRGKIVEIDLVADLERIRQLDLAVLDDGRASLRSGSGQLRRPGFLLLAFERVVDKLRSAKQGESA